MSENQNTPGLRFEGFADPWKLIKLGELFQALPFKPFLKEPEEYGKYEVIQQGNKPIIGFANGNPCTEYKDTVLFGDHTLSLYKPQKPFSLQLTEFVYLKVSKISMAIICCHY